LYQIRQRRVVQTGRLRPIRGGVGVQQLGSATGIELEHRDIRGIAELILDKRRLAAPVLDVVPLGGHESRAERRWPAVQWRTDTILGDAAPRSGGDGQDER